MPTYKAMKRNELSRAACNDVDKSPKYNVEKKKKKRLVRCVQYVQYINFYKGQQHAKSSSILCLLILYF